ITYRGKIRPPSGCSFNQRNVVRIQHNMRIFSWPNALGINHGGLAGACTRHSSNRALLPKQYYGNPPLSPPP
ncbi:MAG: hypothetical protein AAFY20_27660, partial [Cyanobacteria bacterium J06639_14]